MNIYQTICKLTNVMGEPFENGDGRIPIGLAAAGPPATFPVGITTLLAFPALFTGVLVLQPIYIIISL
jgi:hypothetical protein